MSKFYLNTEDYKPSYSPEGFRVFFLGEDGPEYTADFNNSENCILWAAYQVFVEERVNVEKQNVMICEKGSGRPVLWFTTRIRLLEYAWYTSPIEDDDEDAPVYSRLPLMKDDWAVRKTNRDWFIFPAGTDWGDIQHWFCSHGVSSYVRWNSHFETGFQRTGPKKTFPWTAVVENGKTNHEAMERVEREFALATGKPFRQRYDDMAVLISPVINALDVSGQGEITAVLTNDKTIKGYYHLFVDDCDELFPGNKDAIGFQAGGLMKATEIASKLILNAVNGHGERTEMLRKRYLRE